MVEQPIADVPNNRYRMCIGTEDNPGKVIYQKRYILFQFELFHSHAFKSHQRQK